MPLPSDFIASLEHVQPDVLLAHFTAKVRPRSSIAMELRNELRPIDLFCYLEVRFGPPNGLLNLLRQNDSDNLIHWEWTLRHPGGFVSFMGMSFRTEVHIDGDGTWVEGDRDELVRQIKSDLPNYGVQMTIVRKSFEYWIEFVNPYQRIRRAVDRLLAELNGLGLQPAAAAKAGPWDPRGLAGAGDWAAAADRFSRGFGLCFGVRSMVPVLAEAFVNLLLYILIRPEIRLDQRLFDNVFRQPIDIRIKSLSINCLGFARAPDYTAAACRAYHSLVNERNDLLHGNVVIDKLKFNEVCFLGTVPIFQEYRSVWERSLGIEAGAVGLDRAHSEVKVVDNLISYLLSCLADNLRAEVEEVVSRFEMAFNQKTGRFGVLFPEHLVDFRIEHRKAADKKGKRKVRKR